MLVRIAENQDSAKELKKLLANNPPWRKDFFRRLNSNISDARTPLTIFLSLKDTGAPPTNEEISYYLNFLIDHKLYDLAYYCWLQFLPVEQLSEAGNLFNGSFEFTPSGLPFDWVWKENSGFTIEIAAPSDQEKTRALHIEFLPDSGRVDFSAVTELVMLPPGNYQFQGRYRGTIISQRGLQWRISCAGDEGKPPIAESPKPAAESPMGSDQDSAWQDLQFSFSVPQANCPAQYVALISSARSASEQFISGTIWYDDLKITDESVAVPSKEVR